MGKKAIRARLDKAMRDLAYVGITRTIRASDRITGFVVGVNDEWVLVAPVSDKIELDGWVAVRIADIGAVDRTPTSTDCFEVAALKKRDMWPPAPPAAMAIGSLADLLDTAGREARLISVYREWKSPNSYCVGVMRGRSVDEVRLLEIDSDAVWMRKPKPIDADDITRVEFGGRYEDALALVGGPPPKARR